MLVRVRLVRLLALVVCLVAGVAAPVAAGESAERPPVPPPHTSARPPDLLTLDLAGSRSTAAREALTRVVHRLGGEVRGAGRDELDVLVPAGRTAAAVRTLAARLGAERVAVSAVLRPAYLPDDRRVPRQGHLGEVRLPQAWQRSQGSPSVTIAVLDTGVDRTHPDLRRKVVGSYNAVTGTSTVTDEIGHGTAVAGVAAAATDNGRGVAGAGFDTSLLAVKVATPGRTGVIYGMDLARGIEWATDQGADVINMSLGGPAADAAMRDAVAYAVSQGVVLVAAAGNEGDTVRSYPAALEGVLSVGATDGLRRARFSTYGGWVDVAAPGRGIYTTIAGGGYARWDGTSFAAPIVAGQAALLLARRPGATPQRIEAVIERSTTAVGAAAFAHGRVDVRGSLDWLLGAPPTAPRATTAAPGAGSALVSWQAPLTTYGASVSRYRVEVRGPSGVWRAGAAAAGTKRSATVDRLRNGVAYDVRVRAESAFGLGRPGEVARVRVGAPSAPLDLVLVPAGGRISAEWQRPAYPAAGVTGYLVQSRPVGEPRWARDAVSTRRWSSPALPAGVARYEVQVRAVNEYGASAASAVRRLRVGG